ncbi:MAG TPA: hypothetical protein VKV17_13405, partial [Bryobacteraceae bacterium]|nr:hypothetical protein [Bryobacteraceae bacterium]
MQLTEAEAAFRALKSELSIRPLFHQLEPRVKAHVMVAFLGYALWVTRRDASPSNTAPISDPLPFTVHSSPTPYNEFPVGRRKPPPHHGRVL